MAVAAGYRIELDSGDDGRFATDLSAKVIALRWRLGMAKAGDRLAAPARAEISLRNETRRFSPEASALPLRRGLSLRLRYLDSRGRSTTLFLGDLTRVVPQSGAQGARRAVIHAEDIQAQLRENRIELPPRAHARPDEVIAAILDSLPLRRPRLAGRAILGLRGHNALGRTTRLFSGQTVARRLQRGRSHFVWLAEGWLSGISAWEAIARFVESERGHFYTDRLGRLVFLQRHHLLLPRAPRANFNEDALALEYEYGGDFVNEWSVTHQPRNLGPRGVTLWQLSDHLRLDGDAEVVLRAHYRDERGRSLGAASVEEPQPQEDYRAHRHPETSAGEESHRVHLRLLERSAASALLRVQNDAPHPLFLTKLRLRGQPILLGDPLTVVARDGKSIARFGRRPGNLPLLAPNEIETAAALARFELAQSANPRGRLSAIRLAGPAHLPQILARNLFDCIQIQDEQTGHSAPYFIVAEEHEVTLGGHRHECRWLLAAAFTTHFATLGHSRLKDQPLLAY